MIEIIAGVIVLILAIIGIAKLATGRGGGGGKLEIDDVVTMASNSEKALAQAIYSNNPEQLQKALAYLRNVAGTSKQAISALYQKSKITRERVDSAVEKYNIPIQDKIDHLQGLLEIYEVAGLATNKYRSKNIDAEQFRLYIAGEIKAQKEGFKRRYALRHAGMSEMA